jgi:subtilisin family serine protease
MVDFSGPIADLLAVGFEPTSLITHPDGTFLADGRIWTSRLRDLAAIPHVVAAEAPPELTPELSDSGPEIKVNSLRRAHPEATGEGVVIGIIDTGIEWRHGTFCDATGRTRILAIWDQGLPHNAQAGEQPRRVRLTVEGPQGPIETPEVPIGTVYTKRDIDFSLGFDVPDSPTQPAPVKVRSVDPKTNRRIPFNRENPPDPNRLGHGTHVAGIAAGNGSPGYCCHPSGGKYVGVAPSASIVAVRLLGTPGARNAHLSTALEFIAEHAGGHPVVVNISDGSNQGAHDGNSLTERRLDAWVAEQASPTRVVVKSAGNEGATNKHISTSVSGNTTVAIDIHIPDDIKRDQEIDIWYPDGTHLDVELRYSGKTTGMLVQGGPTPPQFWLDEEPDPQDPSAPRPAHVGIDWNLTTPYGLGRQLNLTVTHEEKRALPRGVLELRLRNPSDTAVRVDGWIQKGLPGLTFTPHDDGGSGIKATRIGTLTVPGTARSVVTVANYATGSSTCGAGGDLDPTSSYGPVRQVASTPAVAAALRGSLHRG